MKKRLIFLSAFLLAVMVMVSFTGMGQQDASGIKAASIEDWETGDFSQYEWQFEGNADWFITDVNPYEGVYSAQSMDIGDGQSAALYLEYNVYDEDTLSFWYRVSSESNYDYLNFYIDDVLIDEWAGEIPWSLAQFVVPVGMHTLKWEYDKDFSVSSGQDAVWIDLITFPPEEVQALFVADTTVICQGDIVFFTDLSIGPITEWSWIFEGALPSTSASQNPVVGYPTVGNWDVFLEVTDGIETAVYYQGEYIHVSATPDTANTPIGISSLCASWGNTTYNTIPMGGGVTAYDWKLTPPEAGTISGNGGTNVTVIWDAGFLGAAELQVGGINYCGVGAYSDPLVITRYLPDVAVMLPAYVALPEPPFQLTGGTPPGGEYSGTGVSNGWFDPSAAGMGPHTITYTFTDVNLCTNSATDIITVTEFIGIDESNLSKAVGIYPNPNTGGFSLDLNTAQQGRYDIRVINTVNEVLYHEAGVQLGAGMKKQFDLNLANGIYFVKLSNKDQEFVKKMVVQH